VTDPDTTAAAPIPPAPPVPPLGAPAWTSASLLIPAPGVRAGRTVTIDAAVGLGWGTPAEVVLRLGVARTDDVIVRSESLRIGDQVLEPTVDEHGSSLALITTTGEQSWVAYRAEVELVDRPTTAALTLRERLEFTAPSRYCPSDSTAGFAAATFGPVSGGAAIDAVANWVHDHTSYQFGSSQVTTTAVDTLASAAGVCRDFAHLTICLLRGLGVPARYVAVYAPGLRPQDFHALVEAHDGERWRFVDATGLADPTWAVRICTGRDGADVPFMASLSGNAPVTDVVVDAALQH
jgi:transglutaminase-like putative cysteine protease